MYRIGQEEIAEVTKVILSKQLFRVGDPNAGHLQEAERFEQEWADKIGTKYSLIMSGGGTAALVCSLAGMGIGPGDEVIVPAYTWLATATSVLTVGAIPVLAEVDETLALDPDDLERKISPATKAVIPVHMMGRPANLERIIAVAKKHGIKVLEDCCQMVGGSFKGKRVGSWGDAGAFSFNYFKIITSGGEGGAMVTSDREIYERAFVYHDSGAAFRPKASELKEPIFVAQQYRADEVMAAIARIQAQRLDGILADLRRVRKAIEAGLATISGLKRTPNNDIEGDCGVVSGLQFESEKQARAFIAASGVGGYLGIDHGKHVFTNWEPLIAKRSMHHPDMNPFNFPKNKGLRANYTAEVCPKTLELLKRSFFIVINPDATEKDIAEVVTKCQNGAKAI
jgi:dTDP-4-amino-4,6-dideoxygalactose transaminase